MKTKKRLSSLTWYRRIGPQHVGAQWELPGAVARGGQSHASVSSSIPARRRAFCPDGDLGSRNRPFPEGSPSGWLKARWSGTTGFWRPERRTSRSRPQTRVFAGIFLPVPTFIRDGGPKSRPGGLKMVTNASPRFLRPSLIATAALAAAMTLTPRAAQARGSSGHGGGGGHFVGSSHPC